MPSKDQQLADALVARSIDIFRFTASERAKVITILKRMEDDLIDLLFFSGRKLTDIGREDKARLLKQAQTAIEQYYAQAGEHMDESLSSLARVEASAMAGDLSDVFQSAIVPALPTEGVFKRLVDSTLIQGAPSADWWNRQAGDVAFRFRTEVAQGLAQAETNDQIITRIRGRATSWQMVDGKRVYTYSGGVMDIARNNAATLVQTSVQTVANVARRETFKANDDIVSGIKQVSTLDGHTTVTCVAYSGASWTLDGYKPIAPNELPYKSGTPRHWGCRSVEIPITKTFRELGIDLPEPPASTRASVDGQVDSKQTFADFINRKGKTYADELLGPGRAELFLDKKITLQQLLDQTGRPLTLEELRRKYDR